MSHARNTIRSAIAAILSAAPTAWSSVSESRIQSSRQIWPYVMVFTDDDSSDALLIHPTNIYERNLSVSVVGLLRLPGTGDTYTIEDKMDDLAAEVETTLTRASLKVVVPKIQSLVLKSTSMNVVIEPDGVDHGEVHMNWEVSYATAEGAPSVLI
jgi:hypothetical protein